jgi:WD40 repeat protein
MPRLILAFPAVLVLLILNGCNKDAAKPEAAATPATSQAAPAEIAPKPAGLKIAMKGHTKPVTGVAFSPDGLSLASGSSDGTVKIWNAQTGDLKQTHEEAATEIHAIAFAPDGKALALAAVKEGGEGYVALFDLSTGTLGAAKRKVAGTNITSLAFSPDGKTLAIGNVSNSLILVEPETGAVKKTLEGQGIQTRCLTFSPDGKTLAGGGWGKTVKLWNVETGEMTELSGHDSEIQAVAFSKDGTTLASVGMDNSLRLWDVALKGPKLNLTGGSLAESVAFSPDGKTVAGADGNDIKLWDAQTGAPHQSMKDESTTTSVVAFSPDGQTVASGGADGSVKLWTVNK